MCIQVEDTLLKQELEAEACNHVRSSPVLGKGFPWELQKVGESGHLSRNNQGQVDGA